MSAFERLISAGTLAFRAQSKSAIVRNGHTVYATIGASQVLVRVDNNGGMAELDGMVALTNAEVALLGLVYGSEFTVDGVGVRVEVMSPDGAGNTDVHYRKSRG